MQPIRKSLKSNITSFELMVAESSLDSIPIADKLKKALETISMQQSTINEQSLNETDRSNERPRKMERPASITQLPSQRSFARLQFQPKLSYEEDKNGKNDNKEEEEKNFKTGNSKCPHGRRIHRCKECFGSSICGDGKQRSSCNECGGNSLCPHDKIILQKLLW
mmetsp:Transcript_15378/g.14740  ORF Transcript_15378/g.14740 Transcript_15378/m.14740 type:complete len:165 (-) Transcript_15378:181-675(-)